MQDFTKLNAPKNIPTSSSHTLSNLMFFVAPFILFFTLAILGYEYLGLSMWLIIPFLVRYFTNIKYLDEHTVLVNKKPVKSPEYALLAFWLFVPVAFITFFITKFNWLDIPAGILLMFSSIPSLILLIRTNTPMTVLFSHNPYIKREPIKNRKLSKNLTTTNSYRSKFGNPSDTGDTRVPASLRQFYAKTGVYKKHKSTSSRKY